MPKVIIDRDGCVSCASCWTECPQFFEENQDDTFSQVCEQYRTSGKLAEGDAPDELTSCVKAAEDLCPVQVIHVV